MANRPQEIADRADAGLARFVEANGDWLTAVAFVVISVVLSRIVDRWLQRRGRRFAEAVVRGRLTQEADTRLRFVRRLVAAAIILFGLTAALGQFTGLSRLATSLLASGAIAAAVVGFAARQTLANVIAGMMLAISQPLRVGDWVTFEDAYGVVEDVKLNYTVLRTAADQRVIIPNEKLATGILRNDTLESESVGFDVAVWLAPGVDVERAVAVLERVPGCTGVGVAEHQPWGTRLSVGADPVAPDQKAAEEAGLRRRCLAGLHAAGLLEGSVDGALQRAGMPAPQAN